MSGGLMSGGLMSGGRMSGELTSAHLVTYASPAQYQMQVSRLRVSQVIIHRRSARPLAT